MIGFLIGLAAAAVGHNVGHPTEPQTVFVLHPEPTCWCKECDDARLRAEAERLAW